MAQGRQLSLESVERAVREVSKGLVTREVVFNRDSVFVQGLAEMNSVSFGIVQRALYI